MAGTSPMSMMTAGIIFFMSCIIGVVVGVIGGSLIDILEYQFNSMGWFALSADWDTTSGYMMVRNIFYVIPYIIPLLGLFILLSTVYQRYGKDKKEEDDSTLYYVEGGRL